MRWPRFDARLFFLAAWLLGLSLIWFRPGPAILLGGDAGIYARLARELAERPWTTWWQTTLDGQPFFEHPPLGFWIEAIFFRLFGASVESAVAVPKVAASLALLLVGICASEVATRRSRLVDGLEPTSLGAFAMVGTLSLPGFLYESQVAMLETPMLVPVGAGLWATAALLESNAPRGGRFSRSTVAAFAVSVVLAFWVKGPPALVLVGLVLALALLGKIRWSRALVATVLALGLLWASVAAWDALCVTEGGEPFFRHYVAHQVTPSIIEGRHHPDRDPFFYWVPLWRWYPAGFVAAGLALGLIGFRRRPWAHRWSPELSLIGGLLWLGVVVGFSAVTQKYQWYIHLGALGVGALVGSVLSLLPARFEPALTVAAAVLALAWPVASRWPQPLSGAQREALAIQSTPAPQAPGATVADCSKMEAWTSEHLIAFAWRARRVPCEAPASLRWDGVTLTRP